MGATHQLLRPALVLVTHVLVCTGQFFNWAADL